MSEQVSTKNTVSEVPVANEGGASTNLDTFTTFDLLFRESVMRAFRKVVGPSAAQAIMFYLHPSDFGDPASLNIRLRGIFGPGAVIFEETILTELSDMMRRGLYSLDFAIAARKASDVLRGEVKGTTTGRPEEAEYADRRAKRVLHSPLE